MKIRVLSRIVAVIALAATAFSFTSGLSRVEAVNSIRAIDISVGGETSRGYGCAILLSNEVLCWGDNAPISGVVPGIDNAINVAAGVGHTCAALRTGSVKCWGSNGSGQLGNGTQSSSSSPVTVVGVGGSGVLSNIVEVAASAKRDITCALSASGRAMCWGNNSHGVLGNSAINSGSTSSTPVFVTELSSGNPLTDIETIAVGTYAACAVKTNGTAFCWGDNGLGQLGNPSAGSTNAAVPVLGLGGSGTLSDATQVALGDAMGCARRSSGAVACWGMNHLGEGTGGGSGSPVAVLGVTNAVEVATAEENACVLLATGDVKCWGNWHGNGGSSGSQQVFPLTTSPSGSPILTNARHLATGGGWPQKYCAILNDDTVRCWGANDSGALGVNSGVTPYSNQPVEPQQSFVMGPVTTTVPAPTTTTTSTTSLPPTSVTVPSPSNTSLGGGDSAGSSSEPSTTGQKAIPRVVSTTTIPSAPGPVFSTTSLPKDVSQANAPVPAKVEIGEGSFTRNGKLERVLVTRQSNQMLMNAGQQRVIIGLLDSKGNRVPLDNEGNLDLSDGVFIDVKLAGFVPGDGCSIWMYSTATKLGDSVVKSDGSVSGRFKIPVGIENGAHRIVVSVGSTPGDSARFTLGVTYTDASQSGTILRTLIVVPIALAVIAGLVLPNQVRRRLRRKTIS